MEYIPCECVYASAYHNKQFSTVTVMYPVKTELSGYDCLLARS